MALMFVAFLVVLVSALFGLEKILGENSETTMEKFCSYECR